jgi:hypothetical protein
MKPSSCEKEPFVIEAAQCGQWDDDLRRHAADCRICAYAVLAASFLQQMRRMDQEGAALPNASQAWWKAQLKARREALEGATRPVSWAQSGALLCTALSLAAACIWQWDSLHTWATTLSSLWHVNPAPGLEFLANLWNSWNLILIAGAGAMVLFITLVVWLIRSEG